MKKILYVCFLLLSTYSLNSCKEDIPLMYQEDFRVYLMNRYTIGSNDSINYSFAFAGEEVKSYTMDLHLRIIGFPKDYDRSVKIQVESGSNAVEGTHFSIENLFIPANKSDAVAALTFHRTADMKEHPVEAVLRVVENEHFKPGYQDLENGRLDRLSYKFILTDKLSKPALWDGLWKNLFGDYSDRKILFLTEALSYSDWNVGVYFPQDQNQMKQNARLALYEFEQANGPMIDENNNQVVIP